jgi:hypothetical protein
MQWVIVALCLVVGLVLVYLSIVGNGAALFALATTKAKATAAPTGTGGGQAGS